MPLHWRRCGHKICTCSLVKIMSYPYSYSSVPWNLKHRRLSGFVLPCQSSGGILFIYFFVQYIIFFIRRGLSLTVASALIGIMHQDVWLGHAILRMHSVPGKWIRHSWDRTSVHNNMTLHHNIMLRCVTFPLTLVATQRKLEPNLAFLCVASLIAQITY